MKRSLLAIVVISGLLLAACGDDYDDSADTGSGDTDTTEETVAPATGSGSNIQKSGECAAGTGEEATGEPIKIGALFAVTVFVTEIVSAFIVTFPAVTAPATTTSSSPP